MNLKLRLQNKATLLAILGAVVALVYQVLGLLGVVPKISEYDITNGIGVIVNLLVGLGVLVDPTTQGITDSGYALQKESINEELDIQEVETEE